MLDFHVATRWQCCITVALVPGCMCDAACPFVQAALHVCRILNLWLRNSFIFMFALCFKEMECHSWNIYEKMTALYLSHKVFEMVGAAGVFSQCLYVVSPLQ